MNEQMGLGLREKRGHGGKRAGAGRPKSGTAGVPHRSRPEHKARHPVHTTLRLVRGLPNLRAKRAYQAFKGALATLSEKIEFRVVHYSVQKNHVHLMVEAKDEHELSRGISALEIRLARALNKRWKRKGRVFADRYHARALTTPREVRNCLVYIFQNARKHAAQVGVSMPPNWIDPYSSARAFNGWRVPIPKLAEPLPVKVSNTWLLNKGWRKHRLLAFNEMPGLVR